MHEEEVDLLIDPSLLSHLSEEERAEALAAAAAAKRAEERAEQRELEETLRRKKLQRLEEMQKEEEERQKRRKLQSSIADPSSPAIIPNVQYLSRKVRQNLSSKVENNLPSQHLPEQHHQLDNPPKRKYHSQEKETESKHHTFQPRHHLSTAEINLIKKSYLGETAVQGEEVQRTKLLEKKRRDRQLKKTTFKFEWDATEDTWAGDDAVSSLIPSLKPRIASDTRQVSQPQQTSSSVLTKTLSEMSSRDWRIFRENYGIIVRGGQCPPPLRSFTENLHSSTGVPSIHPVLIDSILNVLKYKDPSPIQRQAIPIGLMRRDLIGIAETGSGKTAAFGIPLCHYVLSLSPSLRSQKNVADGGPLAIVLAPTRELALQIDVEFNKLLQRQSEIRTVAVVGGQSIQVQAQALRNGVHIIVGTPGRINECLETAFLVLNQCTYVVLDEADRMIDMGFAPQIESILDAMGGQLKSEDEVEAYEQEKEDLVRLGLKSSSERVTTGAIPKHRLTAMFSATMSSDIQRIAGRYLRHPAIVSIGDQDGGKNLRIKQRIIYLSHPSQKQNALREVLLNQTSIDEKVIVFVNEKKHADEVGRTVERIGRRCVVLHGGKSQEQREENLEMFRRGGYVMVATDVAGK